MNTDTDALAAYFEAWRDGWPVPDGWHRVQYGDEPEWEYRTPGCASGFKHLRGYHFQALAGVLVAELARRECRLVFGFVKQCWYVLGHERDEQVSDGTTPLCALVAAWKELHK